MLDPAQRGAEDGVDLILIVVIGVVLVCVVTAVGQRANIAGPLILVVLGLLMAVAPFIPNLQPIDPEWILIGVLPPLLYSAAVQLPAVEFRRDFTPIAGLSVLLVVISSVVLAVVFLWTVPGISPALAIALGAILSPTDAVATSIARRMGLAPRVVTMLEGESLLNDATALVLLRTAVAAIAAGFSWGDAAGSFFWGVAIATVVGAVVGQVNLRVRSWVRHPAANTALSFTVPFIAYLPTEALGGSGLVAAVVAGIVTGQGAARWFTPEQRLSDELNWRTVELLLEGGVFLLMGLELTDVVTRNLEEHGGLWHGTWLAIIALAVILAVRASYVAVLIGWQHSRARRTGPGSAPPGGPPRAEQAPPADRRGGMRQRLRRIGSDLDYYRAQPLGWKHGVVIVWGGMRGVVTLAAAQTLPAGTDQRALLVFVAFMVATMSLLVQGFTLAPLVRLLRIPPDATAEPTRAEQTRLDARLRAAAAEALRDPRTLRRDGTPFAPDLVARVGPALIEPPDDDTTALARDILDLRLALIEVMRRRLVEISATGEFSTASLRHALAELDADQLSLELRIADEPGG